MFCSALAIPEVVKSPKEDFTTSGSPDKSNLVAYCQTRIIYIIKVLVADEIKRLCQNVNQCTDSFIETTKISAELNNMPSELINLPSGVSSLSCYG